MPVWDVDCLVKNREMYTETHTEQRKSYLNQKDLLSSQRNFLNYIHPKSIQRSPAHYTTQSAA